MKYITAKQYKAIKDIPRGRLTARFLVYAGAIIRDGSKVLLCQPISSKYPGWQFPGGKVLWSESINECVIREVLEETGMDIKLKSIVGIFQRETTPEDEEFLRVIYNVEKFKIKNIKPIDPAIKETKWFEIKDILNGKVPLQSQQMLVEVRNSSESTGYPLDIMGMYRW